MPLDELADYVSERGNPGNERRIVSAEVLLPREILRGGLQLIDSPGVGGLDSSNALATLSALSSAHAVLLVSDASQEYTEPEVQFLKHAMRISPNVAAVLAKTDLYPEWRQIEQIDRGHLSDVGDVPIFSVSSDLRLLAAELQDRALNDESGFPALVAHLRREVLGRAETIHERSAVHDLVSVVEQLTISLRTELNAILHPEDTPRMIAQLEEARSRADEFRGRSARWQVTLTDGIADLIADMEHDLRDRLRKVQREAERAIEEGDPGPIWDQITEWLDQRVAAAVSETFVWTDERSRWLSEEVADLFSEGESGIPAIDVGDTQGVLDAVEQMSPLDAGRLGAAEKIYIGVRGSYGGVLMVGLATGLVGLSLINPFSLLAGVLVGRRAYREDMNARLSRRQQEARNLVRRYIDEVTFQVGKQLKDRLRLVQRAARDHFGSMAEELHRSLTDALNAAKQAAGTYASTAGSAGDSAAAPARAARDPAQGDPGTPGAPGARPPRAGRGSPPQPSSNDLLREGRRGEPAAHRCRRLRGRCRSPGGDRRARAAAARTAAARDRRHGEGRKVHAAERHARRADRADRHGGVHEGRHLVPLLRDAHHHDASARRRTAPDAGAPRAGTARHRSRRDEGRGCRVDRRGLAARRPQVRDHHRHPGHRLALGVHV